MEVVAATKLVAGHIVVKGEGGENRKERKEKEKKTYVLLLFLLSA